VFNIGFDSFRDTTLNEYLCLEAFALTKLFFVHSPSVLTSNLLALFCFHIARIPAKIESDKPVSFFNQARCKWDKKLISLGFQYLQKPLEVNKFYIEAVIVSKYMSKDELSLHDWKDIVKLYETLQNVTDSPVVKLSYCFCLSKINQTERALTLLSEIEKVIPRGHLYFTLIKARIIKESSPKESYDLFQSAMNNVNQEIRKDYLLENELLPFLTEIKE
jgi:RNA polymerase sigma-70 factor (ECF subfamily)